MTLSNARVCGRKVACAQRVKESGDDTKETLPLLAPYGQRHYQVTGEIKTLEYAERGAVHVGEELTAQGGDEMMVNTTPPCLESLS